MIDLFDRLTGRSHCEISQVVNAIRHSKTRELEVCHVNSHVLRQYFDVKSMASSDRCHNGTFGIWHHIW